MNEARALIEAFDAATRRGERCALATLVSVEGSSYRRPGARMLVSESGATTGTVSAGCLESDVAEHARRVIRGGAAKLVEYDTASTGDELAWGLGLGCNGVVRVLVEPLGAGSIYAAALRRTCEADAAPSALATVFRQTPAAPGGVPRLLVAGGGRATREGLGDELAALIEADAREALCEEKSGARVYEVGGDTFEVFVEVLTPPVPLFVFGAGQDAVPVVDLARALGWQTQVVDPQARPASLTRFARADRVTLARPGEVGGRVALTSRALALLMTHNYAHDVELLEFLLASPARYVGVMGPRKRTERMLSELAARDGGAGFGGADLSRLHAPAGLDIGAGTPDEIALSIIAEMRAVLAGRRGGMLRERRGPIHGQANEAGRVNVLEAGAGALAAV